MCTPPPLYFDHAATTPVDPRVERAMRPYFLAKFGNPGSLHSFGQEAMAAVDASRETLARLIGADFREIVFTGSATEANNLALRGAVAAWRAAQPGGRPRVIVSAIEHESVLETADDLAREGAEVIRIRVDHSGTVDRDALRAAMGPGTAVVSVMYVNNEVGSVQPVAEIAKMTADIRAAEGGEWPRFHTDAAQAFPYLDCDVRRLGVDMMTLSAHKLCGPKGIGLLYIRKGTPMRAVTTGGGQEFGLRSGTENVPLMVGFAKAAELAAALREKEAKRLASLRARAFAGVKKIFPDAKMNGAAAAPHILNIHFPGRAASDIVVKLDLAGVAVSAGSACRSRAMEPSYTVAALGHGSARAAESVRFSFGRQTSPADIVKLLGRLRGI